MADLCLGLPDCDTVVSRLRKSCVPQSRPFKEKESHPQMVPVSRWLALRAASTSLVSSAYVKKLGGARWSIQSTRGREQWRMGTVTGS